MIVARLVHCPECHQLRQFHGERLVPWELQCVSCDHRWTESPALSATETIVALRALLERDCDASRRRFYNANLTLAAVARLVDGFPTLVPACVPLGVLLVDQPGDVISACPFCGEPISTNDGTQRVTHELPMCDTFDRELRKQPTYQAAVEWLKARAVSA